MLDVNTIDNRTWEKSHEWLDSDPEIDTNWLGEGRTSKRIIEVIKEKYE